MLDVVYLVRDGDKNEELRYSLRSLEQNFKFNRVIIVGHVPKWLTNVLYYPRTNHKKRWINTYDNLKAACYLKQITRDFVLMNDDIFFKEPVKEIPIYHRGEIMDVVKEYEKYSSTAYMDSMIRTKALLDMMNTGTKLSYELHTPIVINQKKYLEAIHEHIRLDPTFTRVNKRTLYGNYALIGGSKVSDVKISSEDIQEFDNDTPFLSTNDTSFRQGLVGSWIRRKYKKPSRFEVVND
jgi:hypothetical protein